MNANKHDALSKTTLVGNEVPCLLSHQRLSLSMSIIPQSCDAAEKKIDDTRISHLKYFFWDPGNVFSCIACLKTLSHSVSFSGVCAHCRDNRIVFTLVFAGDCYSVANTGAYIKPGYSTTNNVRWLVKVFFHACVRVAGFFDISFF